MLLDGQPIEFPVEMAGTEQDLGSGPIILQPNGRGVETSAHKYIAFDSGETALYDLVSDPDGLNNIVADPAQSALVQDLSVKLANFPAAAPAPMEAIPVPSTPDIPKVTVPAPISAQPVDPQPVADTLSVPPLAKPAGSLPPPLPKPSDVKLPEPGLPHGVGDYDKEEKAVLSPLKPSAKSPAEIALPKPGLPRPSEVPELKETAKPSLPPLPYPPLSKPVVDPDQDQQSAALKKDLLETFDTDGDGKISEEEKPSEEQLKKFSDRRREKPKVDSVNTKRKSRMEAETAVKSAMRELEEARMREEMSVLEELEAHKVTRDKAKRGCDQCDEEIDKLKQTDQARCEKSEAAIDKLKQEYEHDEELIRHGVRTKKAARLDDEDRIHDLEDELAGLHEENAARLRKEEEEDHLRQEERRLAQERYANRVKADEQEKAEYEEDLRSQEEGEKKLKQELQAKELQMQERLRLIKFEEDDEHSLVEHEIEVLEKSREKLQAMENIEDQEIRDLSAKVDARRIAVANEKKVERRMAVAEHEADILNQVRSEELPAAVAKPTIDRDHMQVPNPDIEPTLSKKPGPIKALPVSSDPEIREAIPTSVLNPKPVAAPAKPKLPELPGSQDEDHEEKDVLPAIINLSSKPSRSVVTEEDEKPAFPLPDSTEPVGDLPALPEIPQSDSEDTGKQKKSPGFLKKLFGNKKEAAPKSAAKDIPLIPQPKTEGPKPDLPPLPSGLTPTKTSADIPDLPPLPGATSEPAELPPVSGQSVAESQEEMERKTLERKLERIADKRAERMNEPTSSEPLVPGLPKPKPARELPSVPEGLKPQVPNPPNPGVLPPAPGTGPGGLPSLPLAGGDKPALPSLPKPGAAPSLPKPGGPAGGLPPLPSPTGGDKPALPPLPKPEGPVGGLPPLPGNDK